MITSLRNFIVERRLIVSGDCVMAAVSGGADSVALLYALDELREAVGFDLSVCHLNHQLRGSDADEDENFVRKLCEKLNLQIYAERCDVKVMREEQGGSLEEVARDLRYDFFERAAGELNANKIALGHHRDDQCETVLFNLIRGASVHGLRGIPHRRPLRAGSAIEIVRPMLEVSKIEIEDFLKQRKAPWRTDASNFEFEANRNVIRHKILPAMMEINSAVREQLLLLSNQANDIEILLGDQTAEILKLTRRDENSIRIEVDQLRCLSGILACEVVRQMLILLGSGLGQFTAEHYRKIVDLACGPMDLPGGLTARVEYGWLILCRSEIGTVAEGEKKLLFDEQCQFGRFCFSAEETNFEASAFRSFLRNKNSSEEWMDAGKIVGDLRVRYAKEGERFKPIGSPGRKKVGDFLTDVKAGFAARPAMVVADDEGIVWLVGQRVSDRVRIDDKTENTITLCCKIG